MSTHPSRDSVEPIIVLYPSVGKKNLNHTPAFPIHNLKRKKEKKQVFQFQRDNFYPSAFAFF
jgi:hypothetical protein